MQEETYLVQFLYDACSPEGNMLRGQITAKSLEEAGAQLHRQGLFIISLKQHGKKHQYVQEVVGQIAYFEHKNQVPE